MTAVASGRPLVSSRLASPRLVKCSHSRGLDLIVVTDGNIQVVVQLAKPRLVSPVDVRHCVEGRLPVAVAMNCFPIRLRGRLKSARRLGPENRSKAVESVYLSAAASNAALA